MFAYAKINLALAITGRRSDGYHELESVMQSIGLYDRIWLTLTEGGIECICGEWSGPGNLAYRAAKVFLAGLNNTDVKGVRIEIEKNIPVQAGLAGGSSDAAATLQGLNTLFQEPYSQEQLLAMAAGLGADVAFCLKGGTQWATGVGEQLSVLPPVPRIYLVIVKPQQGVNTAQAYGAFDQEGHYSKLNYEKWQKALKSGKIECLLPLLHNDLEQASVKLLPEIAQIKGDLLKEAGCLGVLMSGSGSAVFGIFDSFSQTQDIARKWNDNRKYRIWVTHTVERGNIHG